MKKRQICFVMGLVIALAIGGCSSHSSSDSSDGESTVTEVKIKGKTVHGTITDVDDSRITINTDGGESIYFEITDDTEIVYVMPEPPEGDKPEGQPPEGEKSEGQQPEEMPEEMPEQSVLATDLQAEEAVTITYSGKQALKIEAEHTLTEEVKTEEEQSVELTGKKEVDGKEKTWENKEICSDTTDENVVLVKNGGGLNLISGTLKKTGESSDTEKSDFYGLNAALAVQANGIAQVKDTKVKTDAKGANGIFATGSEAMISLDNVEVTTKKDSSRGLDATYGGTIDAAKVNIKTKGKHSAAVATDRGEGTISVKGGILETTGEGSPCVYSTGKISVKNVVGVAEGSEIAVVEGKNSISMKGCDMTGAADWGIMLYQSTSGDADEGTAKFASADSTFTTTSEGPMFYVTNTTAKISLDASEFTYPSGIFLKAAGNDTGKWGEEGKNGADVTLIAKGQKIVGDLVCDEISSIDMTIKEGSEFEGTIDAEHTGKSVVVRISQKSQLTLTGESYVSAITDDDDNLDNIISNGYTLYYDKENELNDWLSGNTIELSDGGKLMPF